MTSGSQSFDDLAEIYDRVADLGPGDIARYLASVLPDHAGSAIDVGCGSGRHTVLLADHFDSVVGIDLSAPMIELARRRRPHPRVTYDVKDVMDVESGPYDVVLSVGMLHHVPDLEAALAKIGSLVRAGGTAILADLVAERARLPKMLFRLGAVRQLVYDVIGRRPHAWERFRHATHPAWLAHVASDRYLRAAEFDRRYTAALPGARTQAVAQFRVCTWTP